MHTVFRAVGAPLLLLATLLIVGCASTSGEKTADAKHEQLYKEALQALSAGQQDKGLQLLEASARANPAYPEPWVKAAQVHFEAGNYPMAIKAADEAMKRDPARRETKAIAVVASLRVAVSALGDMREDASLRGNTRAEAEQLAKTLRETLSVDILVPVPVVPAQAVRPAATTHTQPAAQPAQPAAQPAAAPVANKPAAAPQPQPAARTPAARKPAPAARPEPAPQSANPFSVLK
jgi:tetratricopeptide (TPR) repeat protein